MEELCILYKPKNTQFANVFHRVILSTIFRTEIFTAAILPSSFCSKEELNNEKKENNIILRRQERGR